jgi:hypothetical protein
LAVLFLITGSLCYGQERYTGKYDVFVGFSDINAPFVNNLNQPGFSTQFGFNNNRWLATGFDYSVQSGATPLTANLLPKTLQQELGATLPPGYQLRVPTDLTIQTFSAGSQLVFRHFNAVPLFIHPVLSAFRVAATPHAQDPIAAIVVHELVPTGRKLDWAGGYGVGGGADLRISRHLSARMQMDAAWCHPMNDILGTGGWIYRFSVGPSFHFGHNVEPKRR